MNAATATARPNESHGRTSWAWYATLIAIPLFTAISLMWLRHEQVKRLSARQINNFGSVPEFRLTNQNGQPFGSAELRGKIWIADFIYTTCPGPCPMISTRMGELQKPLGETDVQLVSFSVDPQKDTPEVLQTYAQHLNADARRWNFLTGPVTSIYSLSRDGFHLAALAEGDKPGQPVHSTRMVLVDRHGTIRGYYDATEADAVTKLLADTNHLLREQPK